MISRQVGPRFAPQARTPKNRGRFPKHAFDIRLAEARVICPVQHVAAIPVGATHGRRGLSA